MPSSRTLSRELCNTRSMLDTETDVRPIAEPQPETCYHAQANHPI